VRVAPAHPFAPQDPADLAAFDPDAGLFSRQRQRVQAPLGRAFLLAGHHRSIPLRHESPWRRLSHQGDDRAVISGRQPTGSTGFGSIPQSFDPLRIEAM